MVTRAAKDLLKNTLRSTDYHNKMIEEEEMWRHWEMEKGLTMMVSDDYLRRRMRMDEYARPSRDNGKVRSRHRDRRKRPRSRSGSEERRPKQQVDYHWTRELIEAQGDNSDKWGHSGYIELYPEEFQLSVATPRTSETSPSCEVRRGNDDDDNSEDKKEKSQRSSHKKKRKKTKHKRHRRKKRKSSHFDTDSETDELRRGIRNEQRKKRGLEPLRRKRKHSSSTDSDVRIIGISAPRTMNVNGTTRT